MATTLINDPQERLNRQFQKRHKLLRFLRQELWSSPEILQDVLGLASRQATHKTLMQFVNAGVIRSHSFKALGGKVTLFGITPHGQLLAFDLNSEVPYSTYFEPSKIAEQTIRHSLDLQRQRVSAEHQGWTNWKNGDRYGTIDGEKRRPDAIAIDPIGRKVAIEVERTIKTTKRYEAILLSYLKAIKAGEVNVVTWLSPTGDEAIRLRTLITNISTLRIDGKSIAIDPVRHHVNLRFLDYATWLQAWN